MKKVLHFAKCNQKNGCFLKQIVNIFFIKYFLHASITGQIYTASSACKNHNRTYAPTISNISSPYFSTVTFPTPCIRIN